MFLEGYFSVYMLLLMFLSWAENFAQLRRDSVTYLDHAGSTLYSAHQLDTLHTHLANNIIRNSLQRISTTFLMLQYVYSIAWGPCQMSVRVNFLTRIIPKQKGFLTYRY
jgi:hypothetical protein